MEFYEYSIASNVLISYLLCPLPIWPPTTGVPRRHENIIRAGYGTHPWLKNYCCNSLFDCRFKYWSNRHITRVYLETVSLTNKISKICNIYVQILMIFSQKYDRILKNVVIFSNPVYT